MTATPELQTLLQTAHRPWYRRVGWWIVLALVVTAAAGVWVWQRQQGAAKAPQYVTQPLVRGNLAVTVTATGTLQPVRSVALGSELSGTVTRVLVDVNDPVRKGQTVVELDRAKLQDAVVGARADLDAARARLAQAQATQREAEAVLGRQEQLSRSSGGRLPAAAELDSARATRDRAIADVASARASIAQAEAALATGNTNLGKASIRSPIDGVVLARNVEPGNAVAASLQAVTLLTLAEDLKSMKLSVNVDEADVAQLQPGQRARFSVSAHPGREYPAVVTRVAFGSTTTDNVVTYTTQLDVDNADLSLRPGMTATATVATVERSGVLLVPNSALRFTPTQAVAAGTPASAAATSGSLVSRLMPRPPGLGGRRGAGGGNAAGRANGGQGTLWILRDGQPAAVQVSKGLSDGRQTEVSGPGLKAGDAVIVDQSGGTSR